MPWLESSGSRYWRASRSIRRTTSGTPSSPKSRARDERFRNPPSAIRNHMKFLCVECDRQMAFEDRKSTRLNSSHDQISYAVFCLKKKKKIISIDKNLV